MEESGQSDKSTVNWSKDYVEHLRTVHFALLAVSISLFIFIVSYHPQKVKLARDQLGNIIMMQKHLPQGNLLTHALFDELQSRQLSRLQLQSSQSVGEKQCDLTLLSPETGGITIRFPAG